MKHLKIKFVISSFLYFLISLTTIAQTEANSNKFAYRSFSISPLGVFVGGNSGVAVSGDVNFNYGKNIFGLEIGAGTEGSFIGSNDEFTEVNFLYGRSFPLSEKIFTDIFVGAGYFHFNTYGVVDSNTGRRGDITENTIGFPIGAKLQFSLGPRYSMGLKLAANINSVESIGALGLSLQWNRFRE
ncbi:MULTISPECIES: hypothetical protein [Aequorivita]|uniref:hypothetical protein n=1 Tax=Aequorivita TaxID=153265 RepID=UPI00111CFADB|nr:MULTISPECIES: hypothetical protein [Aequorivita]NGX83639.1 hypothetical protein [Aequorivita sp. KMM 9714]